VVYVEKSGTLIEQLYV